MAIIITKQPSDIVAKVGTTVVYSIAVEGDVASYQWQRQLPNGTTWDNATAEGNTTNTLSYVCQHYNDGYKYRCIITDTDGTITYSDVAKLRIGAYGLIADFTLTAIADAIRAKTESSDMILPADMAAMIAGIEKGKVYSGSFTHNGNAIDEHPLGTALPAWNSYLFLVWKYDTATSNHVQGGFNYVVDGTIVHGATVEYNSGSSGYDVYRIGSTTHDWAVITIDFDTGIMSCPAFDGAWGTYNWWYIQIEGASA